MLEYSIVPHHTAPVVRTHISFCLNCFVSKPAELKLNPNALFFTVRPVKALICMCNGAPDENQCRGN